MFKTCKNSYIIAFSSNGRKTGDPPVAEECATYSANKGEPTKGDCPHSFSFGQGAGWGETGREIFGEWEGVGGEVKANKGIGNNDEV